jgi:DNA-binding NarL/FixJ family response regulator
MKTSVFLIEDEPGCRQMLLDVLAHNPMLRVVGQAPSMAEAKSHIDQQPSEVFLVNTSLSDGSGIDVMHYIQKCQPQAKILALSALGDEKHIFSSLHAGASGYLLKNQIASHLVESIVCLINGGGYLCAHASKLRTRTP